MRDTVQIIVDGKCAPKGRPRFRRNGFPYTPASTRNYEQAVKTAALVAMNGCVPFRGPVSVEVNIYEKPPRSWSKRKQKEAIEGEHIPPWDLDNAVKSLLDGCNGVAFVDDKQVKNLMAMKRYADYSRAVVLVTGDGPLSPESAVRGGE